MAFLTTWGSYILRLLSSVQHCQANPITQISVSCCLAAATAVIHACQFIFLTLLFFTVRTPGASGSAATLHPGEQTTRSSFLSCYSLVIQFSKPCDPNILINQRIRRFFPAELASVGLCPWFLAQFDIRALHKGVTGGYGMGTRQKGLKKFDILSRRSGEQL